MSKDPRGPAIHVTDAAVLAFLKETGIADPAEIRAAIAMTPGLIGAGIMGKRTWTVGPLTFHLQKPVDGGKATVTSISSGSGEMSGREMARARYKDAANNSLGNRRGFVTRKPRDHGRRRTEPTAGEFDD